MGHKNLFILMDGLKVGFYFNSYFIIVFGVLVDYALICLLGAFLVAPKELCFHHSSQST